ncbi:unnamed protein product [Paramecium octaurelia]|uniref:Tetratricopeptide repeat protein n=1 Tax=Paramecium octaurelia TaxID=43137 RepID=A0A8S1XG36_PAROT|nr:unnamed protein product [Paramecium octaurelia]
MVWNNKSFALNNLSKFSEAIECCDIAISINPKNHLALKNKGFALHKLQKYQNAIDFYDQASSIFPNPQILKLKADSLSQLGIKSEAKILYMAALQQGSTEKDQIVKQLSKI